MMIRLRITWRRVLAAIGALLLAAFLFAWSGVFNLAASSGHWKITDIVVHWAMQNSVRTYTAFSTFEPVSDASGLVSAAGHFNQSCVACHGAPGVAALPVMQRATPPAPWLPDHLHEWTDKELHWILQHGVKPTGMPAWAATDRPDEVARMTAFVRRLSIMTPAEYRLLIGADQPVPAIPGVAPAKVQACVGCHGVDGRGRGAPDIPTLGGQDPAYLVKALADYASGRRSSGVMAQAAATLTPTERRALAMYFARMPGLAASPAGAPGARQIVERGLPHLQLPACASCHKPGGRSPRIAGQKAVYIADRLRTWRGEEGVVDARQPQQVMPVIARRIPEHMIDPLARYLAGEGQ